MRDFVTPGFSSNLTLTQCQALWDQNKPNSLLNGTPEIWFDAIAGDTPSNITLKSDFNLSDTQLGYILDWVNASVNGWTKNLAGWTISDWGSGLIETRTVEEWLFTANDTLVYQQDPSQAMVGVIGNYINSDAEAAERGTNRITKKTGKGDISEVDQRVAFNGQEEITIWTEPMEVKGTGGTQFAPGVSEDDTLEAFTTDMVRTLEFEFDEATSKYDIDLYRFKFADDTYDVNPDYFNTIDGAINLLPARGAPVYLSKPYFKDGDIALRNGIIVSSVSEAQKGSYDTYIEVEPNTGITMVGHTTTQINMKTSQTYWFYPNITEAVIPLVWFEEDTEITEELAEQFKDLVYGALDLQQNLTFLVLGVGAALAIPGALVTTTQAVKRRKAKGITSKKKGKLLKSKVSETSTAQAENSSNLDEVLKSKNRRKKR